MSEYHPLSEVAPKLLLTERDLFRLIQSGTIGAATLPTGGFLVSEEEALSRLLALPKEDWPQYDSTLRGQEISVAQAGRKYGIPQPTISRWMKKGYIQIIRAEGQKVFLDHADIAFCARLYKENPGQGARRFSTIMEQLTKK